MAATSKNNAIAIVGMSGRFPGAANISEFWDLLRHGKEGITFFTEQQLREAGVEERLIVNPNYVRAGGALPNYDRFDAAFFGIGRAEAELLDPQQRIFLECAWEALESAGCEPRKTEGRIGVFAGANLSSYLLSNLNLRTDLTALAGNVEVFTGNDKDYVATRVSYKLDLRGPSLNVNTACSTSLAAVSLACMHLVDFQCDMALAGGVSVQVPHISGYLYQDINGGLSRDGHCRPFDSQADGCVFGSGVAIVVLKRLADALQDCDHIHAVIHGWGVNNDGARKVGFMAPSVEGHAEVVAEAQAMAGFSPDTVSMIEAHGTGTRMGDPIETAALTMAFRSGTDRRNYCSLGSVKGNVGHLVSAAGVTGLIKTALALEHRSIPPTVHFERPNERLLLEQSPFHVHRKAVPWPENGLPRRAGVSSLGVGGTNVHLCLEEAPEQPRADPRRQAELLILSTQTAGALGESTANLAAHLRGHDEIRLQDVAHTLRIGRREFQERRCVVASSAAEAAAALESLDSQRTFTGTACSRRPLVFLFSGAGAPAPGAIREIYNAETVFRTAFDECANILKGQSTLFDIDFLANASESLLARATYGLPALFATQYALSSLWASWGIAAETMLGYSSGEYVAACLSGVFSLTDALTLVAARGRLLDAVPAGLMLAVQMSEQAALQVLTPGLSIAGVNAPSVCVVSGDRGEIGRLESRLRSDRVPSIRLPVGGAAHSSLVEPALERYGEIVTRTRLHVPRQAYLSTVTGDWIRDEEATDPGFWVRHMRDTVRFSEALQRLLDKPRLFLEIGPGDSLASTARRHFHLDNGHASFASLRNSGGAFRAHEYLLATLGRLWTLGTDVHWSAFDPRRENRRVPLPTYPFQRQRYWVEPASVDAQPTTAPIEGVAGWLNIQSWKRGDSVDAIIAGTRWLVFANQDSLSAQVCDRLESRGAEVVRVISASSGFAEHSERAFSIPPEDRPAYAGLFEALHRKGLLPDHIVHLWNLPGESVVASDDDNGMRGGFFRLLNLFASARARSSEAGLNIGVVSNQMADIDGSGRDIRPEKAMLLAPCLVCPREYPDLSCRAIDVGAPAPGSQAERVVADRLIDEVALPSSHLLVALRGSSRWLLNWEPHTPLSPAEPLLSLREGGVYLLTGGLGNVGIHLAEHLARKQARLILCGRRPFPARTEWDAWLASHADGDAVSLKIAAVLRMEAAGAVVEVHSIDCADRASMLALVQDATRRYGSLHGIFHLAGAIERKAFCLMEEASDEHFRINLRAKAQALPVIADVMAAGGAEFCILFSSLAAVFGGLGNSLYAAANQYMDAFARCRNGCGSGRWISLNWDLWKMPRHDGDSHVATLENLFAQGAVGMTPEQGFEVLSRVLASSREPHVLVSTGDLRTRLDEFALTTQSRGKSGRRKSKRQVQNPYVAPRNEVEASIASIWQTVLGCESVGIHDNFFELGGESLLAVRCAQRIRETMQVEVPLRSLLETPTVSAVAAAIEAVRTGSAEPTATKTRLAKLRSAQGDAGEQVSLVCVPYAGGNAIMYKPMADALPPHYAVYAADPPGSDYGSSDTRLRPDQIAQECVDELLRTNPGSVEVYGHCGGIVTAVEIARMLEDRGVMVRALFAGGVMPFSDDARADRKNVESLRKLSDADLTHYLRKMGALDQIADPMALRFVVDGFRSDAQATFEYYQQYCSGVSQRRLQAPIFCIVGDKDPLTSDYRKRVRFWKRFGDSVHLAVLRGGGHYFVRHQPEETARLISHREAFKEQ